MQLYLMVPAGTAKQHQVKVQKHSSLSGALFIVVGFSGVISVYENML
jgi:hypothetical protein